MEIIKLKQLIAQYKEQEKKIQSSLIYTKVKGENGQEALVEYSGKTSYGMGLHVPAEWLQSADSEKMPGIKL